MRYLTNITSEQTGHLVKTRLMEKPVENRVPFFFLSESTLTRLRPFVLLVRAKSRWWVEASVVWCWQGNPKYSEKNRLSVILSTINLKQNWDRSWISTLRSRRLTAWAMTQALSRRSLTAEARVRYQFSLDQGFQQLFLSLTKKTVEKRMRWAAVRRNGCSSVSSSWFTFNRRQLSKGLEGAHHHVTTQLRTIK